MRGVLQMPGMIDQPPQNNPILTRFRTAFAEVYGNRLERVVCTARVRRAIIGRIPTMILRSLSKTSAVSTTRADDLSPLPRIFLRIPGP